MSEETIIGLFCSQARSSSLTALLVWAAVCCVSNFTCPKREESLAIFEVRVHVLISGEVRGAIIFYEIIK